jgi:hypothetical protein
MAKWVPIDDIPNDKFAILEINKEDCNISPTMEYNELSEFAKNRYASQPLEYFNNSKNLWVINITQKTIRPLSVKIEV